MKLGMEVGLGPDHIVLDGDQLPPKEHSPQFSPMSVVAQRLDGLRCHLVWRYASGQATVLDGDPAAPKKGAQPPPVFGPCLLWPNGWMDQGATWCGGRPRPRRHCVRFGPSSPSKGHSPQFSAHVYCGERAGCISIPLGSEIGLGQATLR